MISITPTKKSAHATATRSNATIKLTAAELQVIVDAMMSSLIHDMRTPVDLDNPAEAVALWKAQRKDNVRDHLRGGGFTKAEAMQIRDRHDIEAGLLEKLAVKPQRKIAA